jgi:hypothetical protein
MLLGYQDPISPRKNNDLERRLNAAEVNSMRSTFALGQLGSN